MSLPNIPRCHHPPPTFCPATWGRSTARRTSKNIHHLLRGLSLVEAYKNATTSPLFKGGSQQECLITVNYDVSWLNMWLISKVGLY